MWNIAKVIVYPVVFILDIHLLFDLSVIEPTGLHILAALTGGYLITLLADLLHLFESTSLYIFYLGATFDVI